MINSLRMMKLLYSHFYFLAVKCPLNSYICLSGNCIPEKRMCDGYADCDDASDEGHQCGKHYQFIYFRQFNKTYYTP